jgi:hypothetical protein
MKKMFKMMIPRLASCPVPILPFPRFPGIVASTSPTISSMDRSSGASICKRPRIVEGVAISLGVSLKWVACARAAGDVWLDIKIVGHGDRWNQPPPSVGAGTPSLGFQGRSPWLFLVAQLSSVVGS